MTFRQKANVMRYTFSTKKKLSGSNILQISLAPSAHTWTMHYTCYLVANIAQ